MKLEPDLDLREIEDVDFPQNFFGDGRQAFMVLKNVLNSKGHSIFDIKCFLTEDYQRYQKFQDPDKLDSNGKKNYLNFQGLSIINPRGERVLYTKNYIKYDDLRVQRLLLEKMFAINDFDHKIDQSSVTKLRKRVRALGQVLRKYQVSFESSSLLILYDSASFKIKMKFLDFSYLPGQLQKTDLLGLDLMGELLSRIIDGLPLGSHKDF